MPWCHLGNPGGGRVDREALFLPVSVRRFHASSGLPILFQFLETDSTERLSKLTVDAEVIAEKYCENLLYIYRYIWSLVISVAAIMTARWELAVYVVVFSLVSVNLPDMANRVDATMLRGADRRYHSMSVFFISLKIFCMAEFSFPISFSER